MGEFSPPPPHFFFSEPPSFFFLSLSYPSNIEIIFDFFNFFNIFTPHFKILDLPLQNKVKGKKTSTTLTGKRVKLGTFTAPLIANKWNASNVSFSDPDIGVPAGNDKNFDSQTISFKNIWNEAVYSKQ